MIKVVLFWAVLNGIVLIILAVAKYRWDNDAAKRK